MFQVGKAGAATAAMNESSQVINTPMTNGGAAGADGLLSSQKDAKESATSAKFGDVYKQIQAKYGEKPEKPREIKKSLGKDDFLRIMLTQMKNQDPTNPFKPEQMATEIAQFTSVEQLQNVNQNLSKMEAQSKSYGQMAMTHLIGKTVTIDRERFPHVEGQTESLNFKLPKDSTTTQIALVSDTGEVVLEKELGPEKAGEVTFLWDGLKANTTPAKNGNYSIRVEAKDEKGQMIQTNPQSQAQVIGISFEGSEPVFLVGDAHHYDKVTMRNIVRVDAEGPVQPQSQASQIQARPQVPIQAQVPTPAQLSGQSQVPFQSQVQNQPQLPDQGQRPNEVQTFGQPQSQYPVQTQSQPQVSDQDQLATAVQALNEAKAQNQPQQQAKNNSVKNMIPISELLPGAQEPWANGTLNE